MRDIVLSAIIGWLLVMTLRQPVYGAYLWAWLSIMNPHRLTYGFAYSLPWAQMTALATLVAIVFSKKRHPLQFNGGIGLLISLWLWMTLTSVLSINPPDLVWERWIFVSKVYFMLLVTIAIVGGRKELDTLIWVVVGSIGFYALKGGLFTIATGGSYRVWGPAGSMLEDNNALAVATLMMLPLLYYLRHTATKVWLRHGLLAAMVLFGASALGSQSRGALLALLAMAFVLGLKSKAPVRFSVVITLALALGINFMPDSWTQRMDTIGHYSDDASAMERIYTWNTLWNVAKDRPLIGAGFHADNVEVFRRYAPDEPRFTRFIGTAWVAHSIYFEALGEQGFVGLGLFLGMWFWVWRACARMAKQARKVPELADWMPLLMSMCQVSMIAYLVGGAFLALMNLDLPLYLLAFVTICDREIRRYQQKAKPLLQPGKLAQPGKVAP
ncbi:MAG: putative O-glycosylation ligase, exosortase A system-associated [Burkholderiales bacterium]|nr:putative O-glycosylation ligase, exosortase A system-associated [Burkholderiales bacterium]MDE1925762.1 putative O-glycosylation ligase, exosortase A system-associated [Burkholderiales bacterium]MDE2158014.1 putative O-glycosylation ligase, exosortase A system-associated [Burkholderiales bacterium]MDE2504922.1 putative O-glycosylation ligase, exosortase A system-associated [Burkholderiales bacterium]